MLGYFYSNFLPTSVGGDLIKAHSIAREQSQRTVAVATVIIDRVIGLWALVCFVALVGSIYWLLDDPLLKNPDLLRIVQYSVVIVTASLGVWIIAGFLTDHVGKDFGIFLERIPKVGGSIAAFWNACWLYRTRSFAVMLAVLMSLVGHLGWVVVFHLSVRAFETPHPDVDVGTLAEHMIIVPVGMTIQALFPSPGGIGGGEAAYGGLYKILGKPKANGTIGCMSQRVIFWSIGFLGYFICLRMHAHRKKQPDVEEIIAAPADPATV